MLLSNTAVPYWATELETVTSEVAVNTRRDGIEPAHCGMTTTLMSSPG